VKPALSCPPVHWIKTQGLTDYSEAVATMERWVQAIAAGEEGERVWLVEHPPIYTAGTSAKETGLRAADFPVFQTGRGGQYTYHGPGQRVAYVMLNLANRRPDVRAFVTALEDWILATLAQCDVIGHTHKDRVGVWVTRPDSGGLNSPKAEDKIAAIGIRVRRWVTFHGIAINLAPDLSHFNGIIPCGIEEAHLGVTSLHALGKQVSLEMLDRALRTSFEAIFGATTDAEDIETR
jgi:lipoyl(octanoyl) transferase